MIAFMPHSFEAFPDLAVVNQVHFWTLDDGGGGPYTDTGTTGGEDMAQVGTVTDDGAFGGISLSGSGAVAAPNNAGVWNDLFSGADKQFSLKAEFEFDNFSSDQDMFCRMETSPTPNRSFFFNIRSGGQNVDFGWYGANDASAYRVFRKSLPSALLSGTTYKIAVSYDGTIDSNDGRDRIALFVDGAEYAFTTDIAVLGSLANNDIATSGAYLAIGNQVRDDGTIQSARPLSANARNACVYDYIIDASEAGV